MMPLGLRVGEWAVDPGGGWAGAEDEEAVGGDGDVCERLPVVAEAERQRDRRLRVVGERQPGAADRRIHPRKRLLQQAVRGLVGRGDRSLWAGADLIRGAALVAGLVEGGDAVGVRAAVREPGVDVARCSLGWPPGCRFGRRGTSRSRRRCPPSRASPAGRRRLPAGRWARRAGSDRAAEAALRACSCSGARWSPARRRGAAGCGGTGCRACRRVIRSRRWRRRRGPGPDSRAGCPGRRAGSRCCPLRARPGS